MTTIPEVRRAAYRMNSKKAPGIDGITADAVQKAIDAEPEAIVGLFNRCLETGTFPVVWKQALVKAIPKPGKEDMTELKSYRPICLLPMLGKVLDSILITRIEHWIVNSGGGYNDGQYGFTRGRSTVDAAEKVVETIRTAKEEGDYCAIISLDVTGAFDNAWWPMIIQQLERRGCPANLLETMRSYLRDRTASIECRRRGTHAVPVRPTGGSTGPTSSSTDSGMR
ncbi:hypothetical protein CBL_12331 [Carabus blaptoides fortunei]